MSEPVPVGRPPFAAAPTPLPGAVLYAPNSSKSQALLAFARDLARRGWRVGGVVIDTLFGPDEQKSGLDFIDLASAARHPLARPESSGIEIGRWVLDPAALAAADAAIRHAVATRADLVIVDKFGPLESKGGAFAPALRLALDSGLPLLAAVRSEFLDGWDEFAGRPTTALRPSLEALWRWWSPYRLYDELVRGVPDAAAGRVVVGANWTLVEGPAGCGLAFSPPRDAPGCRPLGEAGAYAGRPLRALAALLRSWNPAEAAIGLAALNAHYNRRDLAGQPVDGLERFAAYPGRKMVIGRFPELARKLPDAVVIERLPGPDDLPDNAADWVLPGADAVAVTASALGNLSLPRLIEVSRGARIALIGPGTPLTPRLHAYGIDLLSGFVIEDVERAARIVAEGGAVKALKPFGRRVTLAAEAAAHAEGERARSIG